jgi:NADH-quinone oxidoreductase subunit N
MTFAALLRPAIHWGSTSPLFALAVGSVVCLMVGVLPGKAGRVLPVFFGVIASIAAFVLVALRWNDPTDPLALARSFSVDRFMLAITGLVSLATLTGIALVARARGTADAGHGETVGLLLASATGMAILAGAEDLVTVFLGLELLSIPLYVLCASHVDRTASLESGLKYLILGSVGSATALMGLALVYGATGQMQLTHISTSAVPGTGGVSDLLLPGMALIIAGFGFKLSLAPLHQWTPDVYDGAPTAITAFMSVATKAAALAVVTRLLLIALPTEYDHWHTALMVLAAISIVVGNVGALGQPGMKRLLAYSSIAQAGYLIAALSVAAVPAMLAYLAVYSVASLAIFAVISARQNENPDEDDNSSSLRGLIYDRPLLGWVATIGLFGLAGLPLTGGFFGKIAVVSALVNAGQSWLGVLVIVGSIVSLAYYIPPVLQIWRRREDQPMATEPVAPTGPGGVAILPIPVGWELIAVGLVFAALVVATGVYPQPLLDGARNATLSLALH